MQNYTEFLREISTQILRENSRRHLRNVYRETLMNLNYLNVNYSVFITIIIYLFQEDNIFGTNASLTYGPRKKS